MTNKQKKEYLSRYIAVLAEMQMLEDLRGKLQSISAPRLSHMPKSARVATDSIATGIAELIDKEEDFIRPKLEELKRYKLDTYNAIYTLTDSRQRQIMIYRYLYGCSWIDICVKMSYEWAQVHRYHSQALRNIKIKPT